MADTVRAERARLQHATADAQRRNRLNAGERWRERKRRAWSKARPVFEAAFQRQFSPQRFSYTAHERNRCPYVKVSINYEGKLLAWVNVYDESGVAYLQLRPVDAPDADTKQVQVGVDAAGLYSKVAALVEEWGIA